MRKRRGKLWGTMGVIAGAVALTTLSIGAADYVGDARSIVADVVTARENLCPEGMVRVPFENRDFCIDKFEASPARTCPFSDPGNNEETRQNIDAPECSAASVAAATPWRNIARHQAEIACAKAGKRLPTNREWYRASLGTPDISSGWGSKDCNLGRSGQDSPDLTGSRAKCVSVVGVHDMVGNVWEWVDGSVQDGMYEGRKVPASGYVSGIDGDGVPTATQSEVSDTSFTSDYFWSGGEGVNGMIRGGYWGLDADAGIYAVNAVIPASFTGTGAGFRCVK